jgi:DNA-binding response OmpR family regulator
VRRRNDRVAMNLPVELIVIERSETGGGDPDGSAGGAAGRAPRGVVGRRLRAVSQDVSPYGMFVRLSSPLPVGTVVQLVIAPNGERLIITGQVSHALGEAEARTLGRFPGVGIAFRPPVRPADQQFVAAVARLLERHAQHRPPAEIRIVVADAETRILERLSTSLGTAGFSVATATNGMEAIGACLSRAPDVVLVERDMPVVDGLHVLQEMGRHSDLASVPVMMMSSDATDLIRLQAFQLGAMDFIPKPFTVLEVILRARRWARASRRDPERIVLRGTLAELGLPSLLTMFEHEKKSGQLALTRDQVVAWIDVVDGRIVRARSTEIAADSRTVLMNVLDWQAGYFELSAGTPAVASSDLDATVTITHLLLDHARRRDEAAR